ncbi:hypothetical protein L083_4351 [Actinoplanes sp. N902-109]|nr:hypothetical protein L083_4351 [Actinoplanes sp. N902-109]
MIYCSRRSDDLRPEGLFSIRDQAVWNNAHRDLTGVLLFNRDRFLQCLEGERRTVTATFCTICQDARHEEIALMSVRDIVERSFPDWSMGLVDGDSASLRAAIGDVLTTDRFDPEGMPAETTITLMQRMRTLRFAY